MLINEVIIDELKPDLVRGKIDQQQWKKLGTGGSASVWQHFQDPNTVVKVIGGGYIETKGPHRAAALAFFKFAMENKGRSPHLPVVLGINADHPDVLQIRMEQLAPLPTHKELRWALENLADDVKFGADIAIQSTIDDLTNALDQTKLIWHNNPTDIVKTIELLLNGLKQYHSTAKMYLDLHQENWMIRPSTGEIVAADPWALD